MKRREFLYFSAGASALSVSGAAWAVPAGAPSVRVRRAIYDIGYPETLRFVREAHALGIPLSGIRGDVTDLWTGDLSRSWRNAPVAAAGLTREDSLFCLEQLARDYRMRVVFRENRGQLVSWVIAPAMGMT